jgi:hypothetical protein
VPDADPGHEGICRNGSRRHPSPARRKGTTRPPSLDSCPRKHDHRVGQRTIRPSVIGIAVASAGIAGRDVAHHRTGIAADLFWRLVPCQSRIASSTRCGKAGTRMWRHCPGGMADRVQDRGRRRDQHMFAQDPWPRTDLRDRGTSMIRLSTDRGHIAKGRDQVIVQVLRPTRRDIPPSAPCRCPARSPPRSDPRTSIGLIARPDIMRGGDFQKPHRSKRAYPPPAPPSARHSRKPHRALP